MKSKNDFRDSSGNLKIEVTEPEQCLYCGADTLERVELHATNGRPFIRRLMNKTGIERFFPKQHHLYGWRCIECGYVMWFTARHID